MRIGIIGRTEVLYHTVQKLIEKGHNIVFIITAKEAPEYTKGSDDFLALSEKLNILVKKFYYQLKHNVKKLLIRVLNIIKK